MLAFVFDEGRTCLRRDHPRPDPPPDFVRLRMLAAGICDTDLEIARGYMGFRGVLGHEFVGEALEGSFKGRRVVGGINFGCNACEWCRRGMSRHCPTRRVLGIEGADGAFAEELVIPERNLLAVPDSVSDEEAVFAEPLAAACEIVEQLGDLERGPALVLGAGKLGSLVAQVLADAGFAADLVGRHLESLGWIAATGVRLAGDRPDRGDYGLVIDATGTSEGLKLAIASTKPRGHLVLKTTVAGAHQVDLAPVVVNEISIVGSRCGRLEPALELLARRRVLVAPLIDARYPLAEIEEGFARAARCGVRKVIIRGDYREN